MSIPMQPDEAMMDLIVKKAVEGLTAQEEAALRAGGVAVHDELQRYELAAAAIGMTGLHPLPPVPELLRRRLLREAERYRARSQPAEAPAARRRPPAAGWWAAAACLALALFIWGRDPGQTPAPSPRAMRAALLERADSIRMAWTATADPNAGAVSGDLVWNPVTQSGVMRFVGMASNDPASHEYQLWIFDAERDERYPVDGGVFDVPAGATEVLIPIHAALPVRRARLFAVTLEKPGGVVVSQREHILVTAQSG